MKRVLVCVDGSEVSGRALELGVELARATGAAVTVAHVVAPLSLPVDGYPTAIVEPGASVQLEKQAREFGELLAGRAAERVRALGVAEVQTRVLFGDPAQALAQEAEAHD
ncbi:MAG TPA: universal stress protein, partial [Aggregicoccus sp.]|nr:universal stress protein [Aggregicoccus sp.]